MGGQRRICGVLHFREGLQMNVIDLIRTLAGVCRFNANGDVYIYVNGKSTPLHHCVDDVVGEGDKRKRVVTLVAEGDDYYGK
jgi:hypothetical protein